MPSRASNAPDGDEFDEKAAARTFREVIARHDPEAREKNPAAVALGKLGASKGGKARAAKLSAKRRSQIARKAAMKRWRREP
jgi:hypothetical protein